METTGANELLTAYQTRASLLLRLKEQGDEQTWREFYAICGRMIFGFALRFQMSHSEAEDVVQEVCVKMFRQILSFDYTRRKERRAGGFEEYRELAALLHEEKADSAESVWQGEWEKAVLDAAFRRCHVVG